MRQLFEKYVLSKILFAFLTWMPSLLSKVLTIFYHFQITTSLAVTFCLCVCAGFPSSTRALMVDLLRPCHFPSFPRASPQVAIISMLTTLPYSSPVQTSPPSCLFILSNCLYQLFHLEISQIIDIEHVHNIIIGSLLTSTYLFFPWCFKVNSSVIYPFAQARKSSSSLSLFLHLIPYLHYHQILTTLI